MSNELQYSGDPSTDSGLTIIARVYNLVNGSVVQQGADISCPEQGSLALYIGDMPIIAAGTYLVRFFSGSDVKAQGEIVWDGTSEVELSDLSTLTSTNVAAAVLDAQTSNHPAAGSIGNAIAAAELAAVYEGAIYVDVDNGAAGTVSGTNGTRANPCSTVRDAITVAEALGINDIIIRQRTTPAASVTFPATGDNVENLNFIGEVSNVRVIIIGLQYSDCLFKNLTIIALTQINQTITNGKQKTFENCAITGVTTGGFYAKNCFISLQLQEITSSQDDVYLENCTFISGTSGLAFASAPTMRLELINCNGDLSILTFTTQTLIVQNFIGQISFGNGTGTVQINGSRPILTLANNLTLTDNSTPAVTWDQLITDHATSASFGELLNNILKYHNNNTAFFASDGTTATTQTDAFRVVLYDNDSTTPLKTIQFRNAAGTLSSLQDAASYESI